MLSDESQIAGTTWAQLKKVAMDGKNEQQSWFVSLNNQEKKLLGALISAQNAQGDMNQLQPQRYSLPSKASAQIDPAVSPYIHTLK